MMRTGGLRRLAAVLAILGFAQTLAPTLLRHARPSLSVSLRFRISTEHSELGPIPAPALVSAPNATTEGAGETGDADSDASDLLELESLSWVEGTAPSRASCGAVMPADSGAILPSPDASDASVRARRWALHLDAARFRPVSVAARLCRFLC